VLPNLSQPAQEQIAAPVPAASSPEAPVTQEQLTESEDQLEPVSVPAPEAVVSEVEVTEVEATSEQPIVQLASTPVVRIPGASSVDVAGASSVEPGDDREMVESFLLATLDSAAILSLSRSTEGTVLSSKEGQLSIGNGSGLTANVFYNLNSEKGIQYSWFSLEVDGLSFAAVPQMWYSEMKPTASGNVRISFIATDFLIGDLSGSFNHITSNKSEVSLGALTLEILLDASGNVLETSIKLTPRA
jgi:hypothetical protein